MYTNIDKIRDDSDDLVHFCLNVSICVLYCFVFAYI